MKSEPKIVCRVRLYMKSEKASVQNLNHSPGQHWHLWVVLLILLIKPEKIMFLIHRLNTATGGSDGRGETKSMSAP